MPTSAALDVVAKKLELKFFEVGFGRVVLHPKVFFCMRLVLAVFCMVQVKDPPTVLRECNPGDWFTGANRLEVFW